MTHTSGELPGVLKNAWNLISNLMGLLYSGRLPSRVLYEPYMHSISQPNLINIQYFLPHVSHALLLLKNISLLVSKQYGLLLNLVGG